MLIDSSIKIVPARDEFIVSIDESTYFVVSDATLTVLRSLTGNDNLEDAYDSYLKSSPQSIAFESFRKISDEIINRLSAAKQKNVSYLPLKIQLIPPSAIAKIAGFFTFLFNYRLFTLLLVTCTAINLVNFFAVSSKIPAVTSQPSGSQHLPLLLILFLLIPLIHELGHISACRRFNASHGGIGIGFYFIFPVFYSDVSGIWMISGKDRLIVNSGGIYFELIYLSILIMAGFLSGYYAANALSAICFTLSLQLLLPFARYDGYWIISDLFNIPNLNQASFKALLSVVSGNRDRKLTGKIILLALFSFGNYAFIFFMMLMIFLSYTEEIFKFPYTLFLMLKGLFISDAQIPPVDTNVLIMISFFYFLGLRAIWSFIKSRYFKRDEIPGRK